MPVRLLALVIALLVPSIAVAGSVEPAAPTPVIVRFHERIPADLGSVAGLAVDHRFVLEPAVAGRATPGALRALAARGDVRTIEHDEQIAFDLDTATVASRAREVWAPENGEPLRDAGGAVIDGSGIGIAIVDTGIDGLHPDVAPAPLHNFIVTPAGVVPAPHSALDSAHGTHVAGIAAGTGGLSDGRYTGVAPGASLYGFGMSLPMFSYAARAFEWILLSGPLQDPPIRVVNNSWGCVRVEICNQLNPERLHITMATRLAKAGVTVTWSAGNQGGDGSDIRTNAEARNPTPGIISVANYQEGFEPRDGCIAFSSSRGRSGIPSSYPDVAAPGTDVTSTWATSIGALDPRGPRLPGFPSTDYGQASGTSMAAPHVAGIVALMLDAAPALTPEQIETMLEQTATPIVCASGGSGPQGPVGAGAGLVDARAAVEGALATVGS